MRSLRRKLFTGGLRLAPAFEVLPDGVAPSGHEIVVHRPRSHAGVVLGRSGLLIAHLGYVGDDLAGIEPLFAEVEAKIGAMLEHPARAEMVTAATRLSDWFGPQLPATQTLPVGIVWTSYLDGLDATFDEPERRAALVERFRRESRAKQHLLLGVRWDGEPEALQALARAGVEVVQPADRAAIMLEVTRPDGRCLVGFTCPPSEPSGAGLRGDVRRGVLLRAPHCRRAWLAWSDAGALDELGALLLRRKHAVVLPCQQGELASLIQLPGHAEPLLALYPDLEWAQLAAAQAELPTRELACMPGREALQWASQQGWGLAFGMYCHEGKLRYCTLTAERVAELARRSRLAQA